ncbi:MAG TPA: FecR domain-containing protein [Rhodanobacteraceae bacterium]|nr:FecR domain-containing protein [Rhodanobacteraceae bacterium]
MKIYRTSPQEQQQRVAREAAEWLRVLGEQPAADERQAFLAWAQASPLHVRELLLAGMLERELARPGVLAGFDVAAVVARARSEGNVVALNTAVASPRRRRRGAGWLARAALLAGLAVLLGIGWLAWPDAGQGTAYATTLGQPRVLTLADGSVVTLAPSSRIEVALSATARNIWLRQGEANFKVAHDKARPFRVHAGTSVVQAVGTEFSVNRLPSGTVVEVTEGVVRLSAGHLLALQDGLGAWLQSWQPTEIAAIQRPGVALVAFDQPRKLAAGESAHIARNGRELALGELVHRDVGGAEAGSVATRLLFHDDTLADIAAEFNRYNTMQIVVEGDGAALQRYSGVFDARDAASFLEFLDCCSRLDVRREGARTLLRLPRGEARAQN